MAARVGIIVTGTEVLTGRVSDRNGPWLAERLRELGVDVAQIVVVGDRPDDLRSALTFLGSGNDLVITTGGLGPTAYDLTAEVVASFQGREVELDSPVGTAPGLVVPVAEGREGAPVLVLPGPPAELQGIWPDALQDGLVQEALAGRHELRQSTLRLWGTLESELSAALRAAEPDLEGLEITTCLSEGELEIVTRYSPESADAYDALVAVVSARFADSLFSDDGRTIAEIVTDALLESGSTIAAAESCTAGLLAGRLADRAGSSAYLVGGLVTYADEAKRDLLGVPQELLDEFGAVSAEVAQAMAEGARRVLGTTMGVGITGIAGPAGGTPEKPVGLVHLCVSRQDRALSRRVVLPGSRTSIRTRSVGIALHLVRELLEN